jgi:hypothetical protein
MQEKLKRIESNFRRLEEGESYCFRGEFDYCRIWVLSATLKISQQIHNLNIKFNRNIYYSTPVQIIPSFRVIKFEPIFDLFFELVFRVVTFDIRFKI